MGFIKWLNKIFNPNHDWSDYDENGNMTGRGFGENLNKLFNPNHDWTDWDTFYDNKQTLKDNLTKGIQQLNDPEQITSYVNGLTGAHMQNVELERNEMQMQNQEDIYQRQVVGMQKAGLNPALMYGSGAQSAPSAPSSNSAGSFQDIISAFMMKKQMALMDAQMNDINASAEEKKALTNKANQDIEESKESTRGQKLQNDFFMITRDMKYEGIRLANELSRSQMDEIYGKIENLRYQNKQLLESAKTEEEKRNCLAAEAVLSRANANRIYQLLPYEKALTEARTEESKQAAALAMVQAAYQNGLIDSGYIASMVRSNNASASESEQQALIKETQLAIEKGMSPGEVNKLPLGQRIGNGLLSGVHGIRQALTPFGR